MSRPAVAGLFSSCSAKGSWWDAIVWGEHDADSVTKLPFDEVKMQTIKNAVLTSYPPQNEAMRKAVWMKCIEKINTDVRYLFKVSMKKHDWLQLCI